MGVLEQHNRNAAGKAKQHKSQDAHPYPSFFFKLIKTLPIVQRLRLRVALWQYAVSLISEVSDLPIILSPFLLSRPE
jgi:hypothetical protein